MKKKEYSELIALANSGDSYAKNSLGSKFAHLGKNYQRGSLYWYLEAVEDGFVESMWNAGTMLINGEGCEVNIDFGKKLIEIAAKNGSEGACLFLAYCHEKGLHQYPIAFDKSKDWRNKAYNYENEKDFADPIRVDDFVLDRPRRPDYFNSKLK